MAKKSTSQLFQDEAVKENEIVQNDFSDVEDIDLKVTSKKRFRINGDNNKILELNTSDLNVASRLTVAYDRLNKLMDEALPKLDFKSDDEDSEGVSDEEFTQVADTLKKLDEEMRKEVDYIFDSNVSEVCASDGNMWDPFEGSFRYEYIIDAISQKYENNLNAEFTKLKNKVEGRTAKYTKAKGSKYHN